MSATDRERKRYEDKPRFALGSLVTYASEPRVSVEGKNETVSHEVKDPDVGTITETVTIGPRKVTIDSGTAFLDEVMQLDQMRLDAEPVRVRHWLFHTGRVVINELTYESEPGLGNDGSGEHLARASFSITVTEISGVSEDDPPSPGGGGDNGNGNGNGNGGDGDSPSPDLNPGGSGPA
jgi:hypothetical protein